MLQAHARAAARRGVPDASARRATGTEKLIDDAASRATTLMNAASEDSRLLYVTNPLTADVRISRHAAGARSTSPFSKTKANLTAILVSLPGDRRRHDPHPRLARPGEPHVATTSPSRSRPGTFYKLDIDMQPQDVGHPGRAPDRPDGARVSDRDYTVRPAAGHRAHARSRGQLVHAADRGRLEGARRRNVGGDQEDAPVGGTVPATLALTLGAPATFGAFTPGVAQRVHGVDDGDRDLHRG